MEAAGFLCGHMQRPEAGGGGRCTAQCYNLARPASSWDASWNRTHGGSLGIRRAPGAFRDGPDLAQCLYALMPHAPMAKLPSIGLGLIAVPPVSYRFPWRARASAFVLMNLYGYRRSDFHVEEYSTLIGAR